MTYSNWSPSHDLLRLQEFCDYVDFVSFVRALREKQFFNKEHRDEIRSIMAAIHRPAPFAQNRRYPDALYADLGGAHIRPLLMRILSTIDKPMPDDHQRMNAHTLHDQKQAFDTARESLTAIVATRNSDNLLILNVYTRAQFEAHFKLNWKYVGARAAPRDSTLLSRIISK